MKKLLFSMLALLVLPLAQAQTSTNSTTSSTAIGAFVVGPWAILPEQSLRACSTSTVAAGSYTATANQSTGTATTTLSLVVTAQPSSVNCPNLLLFTPTTTLPPGTKWKITFFSDTTLGSYALTQPLWFFVFNPA